MTIWYDVLGVRFRFLDTATRYAKAVGVRRIAIAWVPA
jgi:hypothetical protein